ncbi:28S ribosomal protein S2, mitochondrial [Echinococcus granulosus]|uniref:Small ribosomal subunit protein uS2m n=1 Tax=Echinococcus granulosus TaxID=6210 RepID=A0A068WFJ0_ECHGR|nr:28S ribosomal protein S2, mitochondrial [Echinococcus granulosus]CDS18526.1 28S ribosomal protein S2 mitochondrial [Echinococcus granulosus]
MQMRTLCRCPSLALLRRNLLSTIASSSSHTSPAMPDPLQSPDYFGLRDVVSVEQLFKVRAHLGHRSMLRNPYMTPYLFGTRQGIDIFDLEQTAELLFDALNFTAHIAYRGGIILFMIQHRQMMHLVEKTAKMIGEYSYCRPWGGGVFTDSTNFFGATTRLPDLIIMLNTVNPVGFDHVAVRDAAKMLIPTVGIVDSNCDPRLVTYPVPGNDDSPVTIRHWCGLFAEAIAHAKRRARRDDATRKRLASAGGLAHP